MRRAGQHAILAVAGESATARRRGRDGLKLIYTIGYQRLTSRRLEKIVGDLDAILVDYRPFSQRPEFSGDRLAE